jgi:hypothetical protein
MRETVLRMVILVVGAIAVHLYWGISLGMLFFALFVIWPLAGTLITADDDLPGGWSNPDGTITPPWRTSRFWGVICAGVVISQLGFGVDAGLSAVGARHLLLAIGGAFIAAALVTRKWWLLVGAIVAAASQWVPA